MTKISNSYLTKTCSLWNRNLSYLDDEKIKDDAHRHGKRCLSALADLIGCKIDGRYSIRSNKAGIAVSGEVTLHTDPIPGYHNGIYVQLSQWACGTAGSDNASLLYRSCRSKSDYTGGVNNWISISEAFGNVDRLAAFAAKCKRIMYEN